MINHSKPHENNDTQQPYEQNPEGELLRGLNAQEVLQTAPSLDWAYIVGNSDLGHAILRRGMNALLIVKRLEIRVLPN